jgi:sulfide:quinone oxidoreductase
VTAAADSPTSAKPRVVVAGGGVAGLEAVLALHALGGGRLNVTLLTPEEEFSYRPLSVAQPFGLAEVQSYRVRELVAEHGAHMVRGRLDSVDPDRRVAIVQDGPEPELPYDELVLAMGADRSTVFPEALTFVDQRSVPGFRDLLGAVERGDVKSLAFVVPAGPVWPFPLYELALMTAVFAEQHGRQIEMTLSSPATTPLALFGPTAQEAMADMLSAHGIVVHGGYDPDVVERGRVLLRPDGPAIVADRVVALPRLTGPRIAGLPHDPAGFIPVDDHGRVEGVEGVWAAGDCTTFPVKQGGLASQQADVVAATLAANVGAPVEAPAFRPVLRGVLLTGRSPTWLRARMEGGEIDDSALSKTALWWPPSKIAGRYLAPALGVLDDAAVLTDPKEGVPVEVRLETPPADQTGAHRRALIAHARDADGEPELIEFERDS